MLIVCGSHNSDKLTGGMTVESQCVESGKQADEVDENVRLRILNLKKLGQTLSGCFAFGICYLN